MIARTSDSYSIDYYKVETNATPEELREVEFSGLIPTHRSASTSIKQLKEASEKMRYIFEYEVIAENITTVTPELKNLKIDYEAHYGNY